MTGFLILNKKFENEEDVKKFYKRNLLSLLITSEIWIVIYTVYFSIHDNQTFSFEKLFRRMLFFEYTPSHMWYIPTIIGIYLAIPFIGYILKKFSLKTFRIPICIIILNTFILSTINSIVSVFKINPFNSKLDLEFLGASYGIYVILGYIVSQKKLKNIKTRWLILGICSSFIYAIAMQIFLNNRGKNYYIWYNSIFILLMALFLFELFTRIKLQSEITKKIFTFISKASLAIFFIHKIIQNCIGQTINKMEINNPFKVGIVFGISIAVSIIIVLILKKVDWIKKRIFLIKE